MIIKKIFKDSKKVKELEIMFQNAIYVYIFWYNLLMSAELKGMSHDSYIFYVFFSYGITVPGFIIVRYVWKILGRRSLSALSVREQPRKRLS